LSLARSLVRGEGYQADGIPHTLVLPGYPVMLAAIFRVAGEDFLVVNLVQAAFGMGCVLLTAVVLRRWVGTSAAVMLAALAGLTETLVRWSSRVLTDVPHLFFCLLALLLIQEMSRRAGRASRLTLACLVGLVVLVAGMLRLNGLLLLPVAAVALLRPRGNRLTLGEKCIALAVWTAAVGAPFVLWLRHVTSVPPELRNTYLAWAGLDTGPVGLLTNTLATLATLPAQLAETLFRNDLTLVPNVVVVLIAAAGLVLLARRGAWALVLFTVLQVGLFSTQEFQRRYLLVVLPGVVAGFVVGAAWLASLARRSLGTLGINAPAGHAARLAVVMIVLVVLVLNLVPVVKWTVEAHGRPFYETWRGGRWHEERVLSAWMREHTVADEVFWTERPRVIAFLADRKVMGPGTPCEARTVEPLPPREAIRRNLLHWQPRYVFLDDRERAYSERVLEAVTEAWPAFRRVDVPGLSGLTVLELPPPR
ncbi:MAG TPA: glycosyltransferase family 39 protein, partial [Planctomycetota bacterium]|nr:glycosyltransferase family 39 protein [Planctomycetota bacterium]